MESRANVEAKAQVDGHLTCTRLRIAKGCRRTKFRRVAMAKDAADREARVFDGHTERAPLAPWPMLLATRRARSHAFLAATEEHALRAADVPACVSPQGSIVKQALRPEQVDLLAHAGLGAIGKHRVHRALDPTDEHADGQRGTFLCA